MKPAAYELHTAADAPAALAQVAAGAKPLGGGQSLMPAMNLRLLRPPVLVDLKRIAALREVREHADHLRLGAAITHAEIEDGQVPDPANGLLRHVARGIAYRAVRNRGTLGGSLAHADPAADWPSVMVALDARIIALGPRGERAIPAADFMRAPFVTALAADEIILAVEIPRLAPDTRWGHCKINRKTGEFAKSIGIAISAPRRLLLGAIEAPPALLESVDDIPARLPWLDGAAQARARVALQRALAMMDA
ncbi:MAG: FAD binding domain-containing protein [Rubritepida sp.]|jgi:carbon-monoxide dehydrogenase medium subunit|nr:FAD binding domain-containing protein [Rubritepida sp.]